jgi:hypothetical protein
MGAVWASPVHLLKALTAAYIADAIFGAPLVIGSLELIGNPTGMSVRLLTVSPF